MKRLLIVLAVCCAFGCQRNDMWYQAKARTYSESDFFANHQTARPLIAGTVARGHLDDDDFLYKGTQNGQPTTMFPFRITKEILVHGEERYNIYCSVCHGLSGEGSGMIVQRGFPRPPSFDEERLRMVPVGHFYRVMTYGYGVMFPYSNRVVPEDRWAIAAYIRALQSRASTIAAIAPGEPRNSGKGSD